MDRVRDCHKGWGGWWLYPHVLYELRTEWCGACDGSASVRHAIAARIARFALRTRIRNRADKVVSSDLRWCTLWLSVVTAPMNTKVTGFARDQIISSRFISASSSNGGAESQASLLLPFCESWIYFLAPRPRAQFQFSFPIIPALPTSHLSTFEWTYLSLQVHEQRSHSLLMTQSEASVLYAGSLHEYQ